MSFHNYYFKVQIFLKLSKHFYTIGLKRKYELRIFNNLIFSYGFLI